MVDFSNSYWSLKTKKKHFWEYINHNQSRLVILEGSWGAIPLTLPGLFFHQPNSGKKSYNGLEQPCMDIASMQHDLMEWVINLSMQIMRGIQYQ